jgi:hypothetical protein
VLSHWWIARPGGFRLGLFEVIERVEQREPTRLCSRFERDEEVKSVTLRTSSSRPTHPSSVRKVAGLYLNPPDHALLLCVDEKRRARVRCKAPIGDHQKPRASRIKRGAVTTVHGAIGQPASCRRVAIHQLHMWGKKKLCFAL